jgi:hypothetical protein
MALLKHLGTPGESITNELILVRRDVLAATQGKQVPWDNSSLTGEVVLKEALKEAPKVEPAPEVKAPEATSEKQLELAYWNSIKDGNSTAYFEAYLQQYPNGTFAGLARVRLGEIKAAGERAKQEATAKAEADAKAQADAKAKAEAAQKGIEVAKLEEPATRSTDPAELAIETQKELVRLGCLAGKADGNWGSGSAKALEDYAGRQGIKLASLDPAADILDRLKATTVRVCPLVCGKGLEEKNGRCEKVKREANLPEQHIGSKKAASQAGSESDTKKSKSASTDDRDCFQCFNPQRGEKTKLCGRSNDPEFFRLTHQGPDFPCTKL